MERIGTYGTSILTPMAFVPSVSLPFSHLQRFDLERDLDFLKMITESS